MTKIAQLIDTFTPAHYDLLLKLERLTRCFSGTSTIQGIYKDSSRPISVHGKKLTVSQALINDIPAEIAYKDNDVIELTPNSAIPAGEVTLTLSFSGTITDSQHGIYPCYFEHEGEKKELLATQFEPHHAREAFPCVDEPAAKATFSLTLDTENDVTTLSNMPIKHQETFLSAPEEAGSERLLTTFETSPKMSTYLVAFVVGELHSVETKTKNNVDVRIWSAPTQTKESLEFALKTAVRTVEFFDEYFGHPYPLPKADHIALPDMGGGASAAMENWGLITYREDYLIADDSVGASTRQRIARVIVHETSHQWFGNLVTMQWWDELWLNESFASLMEFVGLDALFPEWHHWDEFASSETLPSLRRDSNPGVQSIKTEVNHPDEIGTLFDGAIVYAKGSAVLRMLLEYIGDDAFRKGLQIYFKRHAYSNTTGNDLWDALGDDVANFITPWLEKSGFPVIDVTKQSDDTYTLRQSEFLVGAAPDETKLWPLLLNAGDSTIPKLMSDKELVITTTAPLHLNQDGKAQYIVNYDSESRLALINKVVSGSLSTVDRLRLLLDTTLLIRTQKLASVELIHLINAYIHEDQEPVWDMLSFGLGTLKAFVETKDTAEAGLKKIAQTISAAQAERLGWEENDTDSESDKKLRAIVLGLSTYGENKEIIGQALALYDQNKEDITKLNGELRALILSNAVRHGDTKIVVDHLLSIHNTTHNSELQEDIISGLTGTNDEQIIAALLDIMKDASRVRPQNAVHWFVYCLRNRHGRDYTWQWIRDNWQWVKNTYGSDKSYDIFPRVLGSILSTEKQLQEYEAFFTPMLTDVSLKRTIQIAQTEIRARIDWLNDDRDAVVEALRQY